MSELLRESLKNPKKHLLSGFSCVKMYQSGQKMLPEHITCVDSENGAASTVLEEVKAHGRKTKKGE